MHNQSKSLQWCVTSFGGPDVLEVVEADVPPPVRGQVSIDVRAAGVNPSDYQGICGLLNDDALPVLVGREVSGTISAIGADTEIGSGGGAMGDDVLAFKIDGGYSTSVTVAAEDVFAKSGNLTFPEAANLLLAGTT